MVRDIGAMLDAHRCGTRCTRAVHVQIVPVDDADLAGPAAQLAVLVAVRDGLAERGLVMLESDPLPRPEAAPAAAGPGWAVSYERRATTPRRRLLGF